MVINHSLTYNGVTSAIEEPIGFDNLKTKIKRSDYHGMSVEVSVGNLEFYGVAYNIIKEAYENSLDASVIYKAIYNGDVLYEGTIDLTTYEEQCVDYCSISCKVGEIGTKTKFNNRTEVDVDLTGSKTIEGSNILHAGAWRNVLIPAKMINLTSSCVNTFNKSISKDSAGQNLQWDFTKDSFCQIALKTNATEFGSFADSIVQYEEASDQNFFTIDSDYSGNDYSINTSIILSIDADYSQTMRGDMECNLCIQTAYGAIIKYGDVLEGVSGGIGAILDKQHTHAKFKLDYSHGQYTSSGVQICLHFKSRSSLIGLLPYTITIGAGSVFTAHYLSLNTQECYADMISVHDALNHIVEAISDNGLSVKSKIYASPLSSTNRGGDYGESSLKLITNGYHIRGLYTDDYDKRPMNLSFKDIIESLHSQDCIGWGFIKENGKDYVLVDHWDKFYNDNVIISIDGANEKKLSFDSSMLITSLKIGYKKYKTSDEYNAIQSPHGERTYTSNLSAISKSVTALCNFIADNYSIEEIRSARFEKDALEETSYDESIFIFSSSYNGVKFSIPEDRLYGDGFYGEYIYNGAISPLRNALHWIDRIFCVQGFEHMNVTDGTINYQSIVDMSNSQSINSPKVADYGLKIPLVTYIDNVAEDMWQEDQRYENISLKKHYDSKVVDGVIVPDAKDWDVPEAKFKAEKLKFTYPLTMDQYKAIMADPYGLISIDGIEGWISEMQYSFSDGETEFTLIPKA